jgi:hypothetical protein
MGKPQSRAPAEHFPVVGKRVSMPFIKPMVLILGTILATAMVRSGRGADMAYELTMIPLIVTGYLHLAGMGLNILKNEGFGKFRLFLLKLGFIFACANGVDIACVWAGAWSFEAAWYMRIDFLFTRQGVPVALPWAEVLGFNLSIIGVILYLAEYVGLKAGKSRK